MNKKSDLPKQIGSYQKTNYFFKSFMTFSK